MKNALQEQLVATRRNQILDGAAKVFAEKGFHSATIRDIAREVGIADGTIYNYFDNKPALLLGIFDRIRASVQPNLVEPDEGAVNLNAVDFRSFLEAYFRYPLMALKSDNFALFRVIISEMLINESLRELYFKQILEPAIIGGEQILQQWAARHAIKPTNIALTTRAVSAIILGLMLENIMGDTTLEAQWEALPAFLADLFLHGIGHNG
jgi:AcrR family transcriptional regulator